MTEKFVVENPEASRGIPEIPSELTIQYFLSRNPNLELMKEKRNSFQGFMKYIKAAIFGFLLFSPVLTIIPDLAGGRAWVIPVLWILIALIMVCYLEYWARAECWYSCICRGIIVDFRKTDSLKLWACNPVMFIAYAFIIIAGVLTAIGKDDTTINRIVTGLLFVVGLLFVIFMTKGVIDLEGASRLQTLNLLLHYFVDPDLLKDKGFKTVHETQLAAWVKANKNNPFSWNYIFALSHEKNSQRMSPLWGIQTTGLLKKYRDHDE
eukprot:NODE_1053_length_1141_cov_293.573260_g801_i0.p1 GENE.NODE_1053_length_1141_cov_293.573260_g801_i0~~NODE_1053_length_1141_cov_293.573260_g801_i0.p1  ORF type:complete len:265 (+),score=45.54 NODE_1053_length_1141_cov_293.573260_g801_i0:135-929(+)